MDYKVEFQDSQSCYYYGLPAPTNQLFCIVAVTYLPVTEHGEETTQQDHANHTPRYVLRFGNLEKSHRVLCRTHQVKGQYELLV